jgi:hypothetical protein
MLLGYSVQSWHEQPFMRDGMSSMVGYGLMAQTAARGIARELDSAVQASEQVTRSAAVSGTGDKVEVSSEAVSAALGGGSAGVSCIERPTVDLRVAKYAAVANVRVLQTADQLANAIVQLMR